MWTTSRSASAADGGRAVAALLVLCSFGMVRTVQAQRESLELVWQAPAGCPSARQVQARIRKLAGQQHAAPLYAAATIERGRAGRLRLRLVTRAAGMSAERELEASNCDDLSNVVAIHLALLLQGAQPAAADGSEPAASPQPSASVPAESTQPRAAAGLAPGPAAVATARDATARRDVQVLLQLPLGLLALGSRPQPVLGLGLSGGARIAGWYALLDAQLWRAQTLHARDMTAHADIGQLGLGAGACRALRRGSFELAPCLRVSVEQLWARGAGPHVTGRTARRRWIAGSVGAQARLQLQRWIALVARLDLQLETAEPRLAIEGLGGLGQLGRLTLHFGMGAEWIL